MSLRLRQRYVSASQQVVFRSLFEGYPSQRRVRSPAAACEVFQQLNARGIRPLASNRGIVEVNTHPARLRGASTRHYSTPSGTRKRSFLFDEPSIQGQQTPIPEGNPEETTSIKKDVVGTQDARLYRDCALDPFGKRPVLRRDPGTLTQCPHTASMIASPIRRCAITGAKLPKGNVMQDPSG